MKLKTIVITCLLFSMMGCSDDKLARTLVDQYFEKNKACIQNYSAFPYTIEEQGAYRRFAPILNAFEEHGYITHKKTKINNNHDPRKPQNIVDARIYTITDKGKGVFEGNKICYGEFETTGIEVSDLPTHYGTERKAIKFHYRLVNVADWAQIPIFADISDQLFDDLSTREEPGMGSMVIKKRDNAQWRRENVKIRYKRPSQDPAHERNVRIQKQNDEAAYLALIQAEEKGIELGELLSQYRAYLDQFRYGLHYEEINQKAMRLNQEIRKIEKAAKGAEKAQFQALADRFSQAIDAQDEASIREITIEGTAASRAHSNNLFRRAKAGELILKSYSKSGQSEELAQLQLEGNIYMIRAKRVDQTWKINGYATRAGL